MRQRCLAAFEESHAHCKVRPDSLPFRDAEIAEAISPEGTIIVHGALSPEVTPLPLKIALRKSLTVRGYVFTEVIKDIERFRRAKQFILSGLSEGTLKPVIDRSFKFEEIVAAHHYLESNQQIGKIVVVLD